jgi:hypothetical protein
MPILFLADQREGVKAAHRATLNGHTPQNVEPLQLILTAIIEANERHHRQLAGRSEILNSAAAGVRP